MPCFTLYSKEQTQDKGMENKLSIPSVENDSSKKEVENPNVNIDNLSNMNKNIESNNSQSNTSTLIQDDLANNINDTEPNQDSLRDQIQILNSQIESLKFRLEKKEKERVQSSFDKNSQFGKEIIDVSAKELEMLLNIKPFNQKDDKDDDYNRAYDALIHNDFILANSLFTAYIAKHDKSPEEMDSDSNMDQSPDKMLNDNLADEKNNQMINKYQDVNPNITELLAKANFFNAELEFLNMNFKNSFLMYTKAYKLTKDFDVAINALFKIVVIFGLQNKNEEQCFTLIRISKTFEAMVDNPNIAAYQDRYKSFKNAYNCD